MFSTITKVLAGLTVASAAATTASVIHDKKSFDTIGDIAPIGDIGDIGDVVPEGTDDAADEVLNSAEV